jgi:DUF4097 and DUF4098 domain-containing protein YvlB
MNKKLTRIKSWYLPALLLSMAIPLTATAATEEIFNRELGTKPGGKLIVDVDFGRVDVRSGADDKLTLQARRDLDFGDASKEKEYLAAVPITINREGNTVIVRARSGKGWKLEGSRHTKMDGQYTLRVPSLFNTELHTGGGNITASDLIGEARAETGGGKLRFAHLQGSLSGETGGGFIKIENCTGPLKIHTGGGDIELAESKGSLLAETGGGAVMVRRFDGDTQVSTGGGELTLQEIDGKIVGETGGGGITASLTGIANKINLESSGGNIDLALPKTATVDINAETSDGRITTNLPLVVMTSGDEHLRGTLNGGGTPVVLRTSSGSISINSASPETAAR